MSYLTPPLADTGLVTVAPAPAAPINLVRLAVADLTTAAAILRKPRGGVAGLDVRELAGGAVALRLGPAAFDTYCAAIDSGLSRMRGLRNRGYVLARA